jgi:hypothetical protein
MLDHIERRRFLIYPAGKGPLPLLVGPLHIELDESPGQCLRFPRRGLLAGAKAHDRVLDPHRLARFQNQVADDSVTLVEEADHGDPLGHRCHAGHRHVVCRLVHRHRAAGGVVALGRLLVSPAAGDDQREDSRKKEKSHAQSGVHG